MTSFLGLTRTLLLSLLIVSVVADGYGHDDNGKGNGNGHGNGGCRNPKVRREWRALSTRERGDWIKAVNCLAALPHVSNLTPSVPVNQSLIQPIEPKSSFYDDLVYMHMDLNTRIHFTGQFLPWHRQYVQYFEDVLIQKCKYKGVMPYWDWTKDAADFEHSAFFDPSPNGVGGWGDPKNDFQIYNGGFKDVVRVYPNPHHVRRNFSLFPFTNPLAPPPWGNATDGPPPDTTFMVNTTMTQANVDSVVQGYEGNFFQMHAFFDSTNGVHPNLHLILGGDMTGLCSNNAGPPACYAGPKWTPNDPLFFLHHAMIDRIWYLWQHYSSKNKYAYGGGSIQATDTFADFIAFPNGHPPYMGYDSELPGDGLWNNVTVWDVIDTKAGKLCYTYA